MVFQSSSIPHMPVIQKGTQVGGRIRFPSGMQGLRLGEDQAKIGRLDVAGARHPQAVAPRMSSFQRGWNDRCRMHANVPCEADGGGSAITSRFASIIVARRNSLSESNNLTWPISRRYRRTGSSASSAASWGLCRSSGSSSSNSSSAAQAHLHRDRQPHHPSTPVLSVHSYPPHLHSDFP